MLVAKIYIISYTNQTYTYYYYFWMKNLYLLM